MPFILYFLFFLPLQFLLLDITSSVAAGSIVNVTIDDTLGDSRTNLKVQYSESTSSAPPSSAVNSTGWKHQTSQSCNDCQVKATCQNDDDVCTQTSMTPLNGTKVTATFRFNGSAIYIYFAPAHNTSSGNKSNVNSAEFLLNGQHSTSVDLIQQHNSSAGDWLVYSISSIPFGLHQFSIQLSYPSSAVFDYAVYTTEIEDGNDHTTQSDSSDATGPNDKQDSPSVTSALSSSSSSSRNKSKLVAITVGVITPLFLILAGFVFLRYKYPSHLSSALSRIRAPRLGWIKSRASKVLPSNWGGNDSGTSRRETNQSRDFKLTPLPRRTFKRRNSNAIVTRPFTPASELDMHCRGDAYPDELNTPRSRFDFLFSSLGGGDKTPRSRSRFGMNDEKQIKDRSDERRVVDLGNSTSESRSDQARTTPSRTVSQSSIKKMYDLHSRPLPPIPAPSTPSSPEQSSPTVRLLPLPHPVFTGMDMVTSIPGTPPGYYL